MRISDGEIEKSLRVLARQAAAGGMKPPVDKETSRLVQGRLQGVPDIRMELVMPLQRAVREGCYYVPDEMVAEKMIGRSIADHLR